MILTSKNIITLKETDSTNNYAKQLIVKKVEEGTVVLAHYQQQGRGQQGNFWESEAHKNLLFSLILYPGFIDAGKQFYVSKIVSLALCAVLRKEVANVTVKWPNDIYVGTKKIAGILIENTIKGMSLETSIIGVGLNLNQTSFTSSAPNPVSLTQLTQKEYISGDVLNEFLIELNTLLQHLKGGRFEWIDKLYLESLFRFEEWNTFRKDGRAFEARIIGVGEFGELQVEEKSGAISSFMFKEIEFVI
jgi:BirA family biotin operon repressor/biotin-[acetyl-CoA-carboxylase] ligase